MIIPCYMLMAINVPGDLSGNRECNRVIVQVKRYESLWCEGIVRCNILSGIQIMPQLEYNNNISSLLVIHEFHLPGSATIIAAGYARESS